MEGDALVVLHIPDQACISIHSLRMEGDFFTSETVHDTVNISIHSLRMEGDSHREQQRQIA